MTTNLLFLLFDSLKSPHLLASIVFLSFLVKLYFLKEVIFKGVLRSQIPQPLIFLIATLASSLFGDIAWITKLLREIVLYNLSYSVVLFIIRIAWGFLIIQYQSLAFFIQTLTEKNWKLSILQKGLVIVSCTFSTYFFYIAFFDTATYMNEYERQLASDSSSAVYCEYLMMHYASLYLLAIIIPCLYFAFQRIHSLEIPKILRSQLKIFIRHLLSPYLFVEFLLASSFIFPSIAHNLYPIITLSTILLVSAIYYCMRRVMYLRFLNFTRHVQSSGKVTIAHDFRNALEQLVQANSMQEFKHITQTLFKEFFNVPLRSTIIYIKQHENNGPRDNHESHLESTIEQFIAHHETLFHNFQKELRILVYDEITFSNFYEEDENNKIIINFLEAIDADIFIPLYTKKEFVAYIIISRNARPEKYYSKIEQDEMIAFGSYLANTISLLSHSNKDHIFQQEQQLINHVYHKEQLNILYKTSVRSFLRSSKEKPIGLVFFKNRHFIFANHEARKMLGVDINNQDGHPLTKLCKYMTQQVEIFKSSQTHFTHNGDGLPIIINAMPNSDYYTTILTISYPDISDIITQHIDYLKNPNDWEYLLYLKTTRIGNLINQLIPGFEESLLSFKIELLKLCMNKHAALLNVPDDDVLPIVELVHHISLKEVLHVLDTQHTNTKIDLSAMLFGINPLLGIKTTDSPLLEKLNNVGTLFIKNIDGLPLDIQNQLAEFMQTGLFRIGKSDVRIKSNVRILCSTHQNLTRLLQEGKFSENLYNELKKNMFIIPELISFSDLAICSLADGFAEQAIKSSTYKNILTLAERDKIKLIQSRPSSLQELKMRVQNLLIHKSKKHHIYDETDFDPAYDVSDPELFEAARLGKYALKDPKTMSLLWQKFKNQNKIATFLGVNRSSVNRRCKEYNLLAMEEIHHES